MSEEAKLRPETLLKGLYGEDGQPRFFSEPGMDRFVAVILNMASQLWVQEERLRALEHRTANDADCQLFVDQLFAPLRGA